MSVELPQDAEGRGRMTTMKPCPFCGRRSTTFRIERLSGTKGLTACAVRCYRCGAEGPMSYGYGEDSLLTMKAAASFWNGRANDEGGN